MRSDWYIQELRKAILGYRETIASLEETKRNIRPCDKNGMWCKAAENRIQHLKESLASLERLLPDTPHEIPSLEQSAFLHIKSPNSSI